MKRTIGVFVIIVLVMFAFAGCNIRKPKPHPDGIGYYRQTKNASLWDDVTDDPPFKVTFSGYSNDMVNVPIYIKLMSPTTAYFMSFKLNGKDREYQGLFGRVTDAQSFAITVTPTNKISDAENNNVFYIKVEKPHPDIKHPDSIGYYQYGDRDISAVSPFKVIVKSKTNKILNVPVYIRLYGDDKAPIVFTYHIGDATGADNDTRTVDIDSVITTPDLSFIVQPTTYYRESAKGKSFNFKIER